MTYLEIIQLLMNTARRSPNINTVVREFTDLNREGIEYSAIVIQDRDGYREYINNQDYITYTWYIGYVDMLTEEDVNSTSYPAPKTIDNRDDIVSTGINVINDIINTINDSYYPHLELTVSDRINTFHQRFTAECAGVYLVLNANVPLSDCSESEVELFNKLSETITENGVYHYVPSGEEVAFDGVDITVNVPAAKPEESLVKEITSNGRYSYTPDSGKTFSDVNLSVDVHPSSSLSVTYTTNGVRTVTGEWKNVEITVAVPRKTEELLSKSITSNGSYSFLPSSGNSVISKVDLAVDVHPSRLYGNTFTSNGYYVVNEEFAAAYITVSVPSGQKPETICDKIIQENGSFYYTPNPGEVFNRVNITTDIHPSNSLAETYTSNGSYNISGEFDGGVVTVAVSSDQKPEESLVETISSNGSYSFSPSSGYVFSDASIAVDVHPSVSLSETYTSNGSYNISGEFNGGVVTVAVPQKTEVGLVESIVSNGSYSYTPNPGEVYNSVSIGVDVHPSNSLSRTYTTNGTKTVTGEFNGGTINISVHPSTSLSETYTSNGSYNISGEFSGGVVTVAVPSTVTVTMTQAQYDALAVKDPNTIYLING